ncbi:4393_t:CDS:2 [Rhizophagus irregularis]|nr:4393_t:CDS:2 [Rhizophagus irregularis]
MDEVDGILAGNKKLIQFSVCICDDITCHEDLDELANFDIELAHERMESYAIATTYLRDQNAHQKANLNPAQTAKLRSKLRKERLKGENDIKFAELRRLSMFWRVLDRTSSKTKIQHQLKEIQGHMLTKIPSGRAKIGKALIKPLTGQKTKATNLLLIHWTIIQPLGQTTGITNGSSNGFKEIQQKKDSNWNDTQFNTWIKGLTRITVKTMILLLNGYSFLSFYDSSLFFGSSGLSKHHFMFLQEKGIHVYMSDVILSR